MSTSSIGGIVFDLTTRIATASDSGVLGVCEFDAGAHRLGRVHKPKVRPERGTRRNRSSYTCACGHVVNRGKPIEAAGIGTLCQHCYPEAPR